MSDRRLHLTITTPMHVLVDEPDACALRAEDESGSFGILPGHTDLLTALPASVLRWKTGDGATRYCATSGGVLTVSGGARIAVACREGMVGEDLAKLEEEVAQHLGQQADEERKARIDEMKLHTNAMRQLMRALQPGAESGLHHPAPDVLRGGGS